MNSEPRPHPVEIRRVSRDDAPPHGAVDIRWSDGTSARVLTETLRRNCPCATCREAQGTLEHAKPLSPKKPGLLNVVTATLDESLALEEIWAVGNYAVGLRWGDGHDTGIYSFEHLRSLTN